MSKLYNSFDKQIAVAPTIGPVSILTFDDAVSVLYPCCGQCAVRLYRRIPAHTLYLSSPTVINRNLSVQQQNSNCNICLLNSSTCFATIQAKVVGLDQPIQPTIPPTDSTQLRSTFPTNICIFSINLIIQTENTICY